MALPGANELTVEGMSVVVNVMLSLECDIFRMLYGIILHAIESSFYLWHVATKQHKCRKFQNCIRCMIQ